MHAEEELRCELSRYRSREMFLQEENQRLVEVIERMRRDNVSNKLVYVMA